MRGASHPKLHRKVLPCGIVSEPAYAKATAGRPATFIVESLLAIRNFSIRLAADHLIPLNGI